MFTLYVVVFICPAILQVKRGGNEGGVYKQNMLSVIPDNVITDFSLVRLPPCPLGCCVMTCVKLRRCSSDAILQIARSIGIQPREQESPGSLLFAIYVQRPRFSKGAHDVFTFGDSNYGQCGHGDWKNVPTPRKVNELVMTDISNIACGENHTVFVSKTNEVSIVGWGQSSNEKCGTMIRVQKVEGLNAMSVVEAAAGSVYTAMLTDDGRMLTFGSLEAWLASVSGDAMPNAPLLPNRVLENERVVQINIGVYHMAVITCGDGGNGSAVYTAGSGKCGKLGHNTHLNMPFLRKVQALNGKCVVQVEAGHCHTAALTREGEVYTFGGGNMGQCGHGVLKEEYTPRRVDALHGKHIVQIATGREHTLALTDTGEVFAFGCNFNGQLGCGTSVMEILPVQMKALEGKRVIQMAAGDFNTVLLTEEGEVLTCGAAYYGELGHGNVDDEHLPRVVNALEGKRASRIYAGSHHVAVLVVSE